MPAMDRVSRGVLAAYAAPALPLAALFLPLHVYLAPAYAERQGVALAALGSVLLLVRLFDALTDPLMGWLSDRGWGGLGRRRIWVVVAVPLILGAAWALLRPPADAGLGWFALFMLLLTLGWTVASVPYTALGAELSGAYAERARVTVWRESAGLLGTIVTLILVAQAGLPAVAILLALTLPPAVLWFWRAVPEPAPLGSGSPGLPAMIAAMVRDRLFLRLLAAYFVNGAANAFPPALFLFYVGSVLRAGQDVAGGLLILYFLTAIAGGALWSWGARHVSKHRLWCLAMLAACAVFLPAAFLGEGDLWAFVAICAVSGVLLGADLALPPAIQADVVDRETGRSGREATGSFFALWAVATKAALAVAGGLALILLDRAGYVPGGENSDTALATLAWLYAGAPVVLKLGAVALMWSFPLDRDAQASVRAALVR